MRNPNGYGSVTKLSGNRRNPFVVRKTVGFNEKGHPQYLVLGYVATREDGMILLANYNQSPWDIDVVNITFAEVFELWKEKKLHTLGVSNQRALKTAYGHTEVLQSLPYKSLKSFHFEDCLTQCQTKASSKKHLLNLFHHLDKFSLEMDIIVKGHAQFAKTEAQEDGKKKPFTEEEIALLWEKQGEPWVDTVLIFLYTGFRISELLELKTENVDLVEGTLTGGTKSQAGKNRIVPIHSKIRELVEKRYDGNHSTLIVTERGKTFSSQQYYQKWNAVMEETGMDHTPHECRHTFRSRLDMVGANKVCIDLMMGHKSKDVGERVYTHKTIADLKSAIELVTN